jgi:molybdopterin converting factor subunit 1
MEIKVLYFATLRAHTGLREEQLNLHESATVEELKSLLKARHANLGPALDSAIVAVNREFAFPEDELHEGDEVALFPPVSGGEGEPGSTLFRITEEPLDLNKVLDEILLPTSGAACVFTGVVRARSEREEQRETTSLEYEAYQLMAEEKLGQVADEIRQRWPTVEGIAIVQRIGRLKVGTHTVMIACTTAHRDTGVFEAARYGIDRLKEIVPIWKKEIGPDGEIWVEGTYHPDERDLRK